MRNAYVSGRSRGNGCSKIHDAVEYFTMIPAHLWDAGLNGHACDQQEDKAAPIDVGLMIKGHVGMWHHTHGGLVLHYVTAALYQERKGGRSLRHHRKRK